MLKPKSIRTLIILGALAVWRLFGITPAAYVFDIGLLILELLLFLMRFEKKAILTWCSPAY